MTANNLLFVLRCAQNNHIEEVLSSEHAPFATYFTLNGHNNVFMMCFFLSDNGLFIAFDYFCIYISMSMKLNA